ncbi:MAG: hypothetical protein ABIT47_02105 [Candidatus Paceibacterota bacterium]
MDEHKKDNFTDVVEALPVEAPETPDNAPPEEISQQVMSNDGEVITLGQEDSI